MTYNETQLLYMLSEGSEYAFRELFNLHKQHIYKVAMVYVKQSPIAEEIVQDVFLKVWLHRDSLKDLASFKSWLYTVAKNQIINRFKKSIKENKKHSDYLYSVIKEDNSTYSDVLNREYENMLQKGLNMLPKQQRDVYRLVKEQNLSYKDAAEILEISSLTVKTHLTRGMNFLRNYIKQGGELICILFLIKFL